ncbi:1-phosphofructokinase [Tessaracoccus antarcticus]|uniref:1-phosphofructokinase n=1 Tax=Tessaracoccus antarcticus TaxID=2479848 RepID=A0A3M0GG78_9ACTN|nr:1-phosphofructokinase [Tessaracoccus antarcticus]RMB61712.1 1-phosphofructokinase [Tessaracoccus antarcticus]
MIVTVTPNPSIDRTVTVEQLEVGGINRAISSRLDPGGKGVNVSRALSANGCPTLALVPLGGPDGRLLESLLEEANVEFTVVHLSGITRTNVAVVDPSGTTTKINEQGPVLTTQELSSLRAAVLASAAGGEWLALCGSLPPGAPESWFADIIDAHPARVAIDASGAAFRHAVAAGPDLIKPNLEELEELVGRGLSTLGDVLNAARTVVERGVGMVVVSLGSAGALAVTVEGHWFASALVTAPLSTVGAGDCLLAGLLQALQMGKSPQDALAEGVAWGSAAVTLPGSQVPSPADIAGVTVSTRLPPLTTLLTPNPSQPTRRASTMSSRTATIASSVGLHARPATLFTKRVAAAGIPITVGRADGKTVNAASMLAVMALGAKCGDQVLLTADGANADEILDELVSFLETDHDAQE